LSSILPKALLSSLEGLPGFDAAAFEQVHAAGGQVTSVRFNPAKAVEGGGRVADGGAAGLLSGDGAGFAAGGGAGLVPVPWSSSGYYLPERPSFTFDPLFHAGAYYVQEASSMFLEQALRQTTDLSRPLRVLDLCAAPGGKSTLLQSLLSADSLLVSNEVIRTRVHILQENMVKWGGANTFLTSNDPRDFQRLENYFDVMVVDAPCSGSGLFRRDPQAVEEWSPDNVQLCHQRQQRILADCWPALGKDGVLIYSTCSYSQEENEDVLDWITEDLGATSCRLQVSPDWNIVETTGKKGAYGYRFYPDRLKGEGFFIACLRKNDGAAYTPPRKRSTPEKPAKKDEERMGAWIRPETPLFFFHHQELIYGLPATLAADLSIIQSSCYLKRAGVPLGKFSVKEFIPEHDLALSTLIDPALPGLPLSREQALHYLRKDELHPDEGRRGWTLVQYSGLNLGWIKILPGRTNNYYPKEWRILRREA
jgi:16S rRNA C967 or C1407 C5-methylase (RsmB/RsmF family)/NOL1/NOP2/fmu family ribosome biogenesis protein